MDAMEMIQDLVCQKNTTFISFLKDTVKDEGKKFTVDFNLAFTKYLKEAYDKYSKVKTLLYKNEPRNLYDFFVCNNIECGNEIIDCSSTNDLLDKSHFNIILGGGGTGKSILMRHFFLNEIEQKDLIPLFIELRTYEGGNLDDFIFHTLKNLKFPWEIQYFKYALESGIFLILLDGYDEIVDHNKQEFYRELECFCDRYSKNWFVVSSRQNESFVGWQRFTVSHVTPLSEIQAKQLIEKLDYDIEIKNRFLQEFSQLYKKHTSFACNPLLLNIMLMTYDNFAEIPEKRHVFYSNAFDALYAVHDATKGGFKRDLKSKVASDVFKKIFAEFCFSSYVKGKIEFTSDELFDLLRFGEKYSSNFHSEAYISDLLNAVCLLYKEGNTYLFTHRSFQEYFTALFLRNLNDSQQKQACQYLFNIKHFTLDSDSVFEMLLDMVPDRFESNFLIPTLKEMEEQLPSVYEDETQRRFLGYVESLEIVAQKAIFERASEDILDWNYAFPIYSSKKTMYFCLVKFKSLHFSRVLNFIFRYYRHQQPLSRRLKPITRYLGKRYTAENVWVDKSLYEQIMQTTVGQIIKSSVGLLSELEKKQKASDGEFLKLLNSYGPTLE